MDGLIEASAVMAGVTVFVLLAVISMFGGGSRRRRGDYPRERYVPGNYDGHAHHHGGDGWGGHH